MEIEIRTTIDIKEIGPLRRHILLVEADNPQYVDKRWIEMARGQVKGLARARRGVRNDAKRIDRVNWVGLGIHNNWTQRSTRVPDSRPAAVYARVGPTR
jgi:hypothetical protein